ncbi:MAG: hypothetical protein NTW87_24750 [Planctomycetota bacterium]|nr:hypothetical protein [Planctomycetota bacterium]
MKTVLASLLMLLCCAAAFTAWSGEAEPAEELKSYVIAKVKAGTLPPLPVKYASDKAAMSRILSADEQAFLVNAQGLEVKVTWQRLGDDGLLQLCRPLVADAPAPVHAAYLRLALKVGQGEGPAFDGLLNALWGKDREAAKIVEAARQSAAQAAKQPKTVAPATAPAPLVTPPTSAAPATAEGKPEDKPASTPSAATLAGIPTQPAAKEGPRSSNPLPELPELVCGCRAHPRAARVPRLHR